MAPYTHIVVSVILKVEKWINIYSYTLEYNVLKAIWVSNSLLQLLICKAFSSGKAFFLPLNIVVEMPLPFMKIQRAAASRRSLVYYILN